MRETKTGKRRRGKSVAVLLEQVKTLVESIEPRDKVSAQNKARALIYLESASQELKIAAMILVARVCPEGPLPYKY